MTFYYLAVIYSVYVQDSVYCIELNDTLCCNIFQISQIDSEAIQVLALQAVFDFLLLYGVDQFTAASNDASQLPNLLSDDEEAITDDENDQNATNTVIAILSKVASPARIHHITN